MRNQDSNRRLTRASVAAVAGFAMMTAAAFAQAAGEPETPNDRVGAANRVAESSAPRHGSTPEGMTLIHGDILYPEAWLDLRNFATGLDWPNGFVPIVLDASLTSSEIITYLSAMDVWNLSGASVSFIFRSNEANYVRIQGSDANNSNVGMIGGEQTVNVNDPPTYSAAHELCHTLGFYHEQSRPDRDTYIQVEFSNIESGQENNFDLVPSATTFTPYDFDSVMHYSQCGFSCCNQATNPCGGSSCSGQASCRTITVLPPYEAWQTLIGQRDHLSARDVEDMQSVYGSGRSQHYVDLNGQSFPVGAGTMLFPSKDPLIASFVTDGIVWLNTGGYDNTSSAGYYNSPVTLRAHGGNVTLGAGP